MTAWLAPVSRPVGKALALLPAVPWYGLLAGAAALVFGMTYAPKKASAAPSPDELTPPAGTPPVLKKGSAGPWVSFLQAKLGLTSTGSFDATTDKAVRDFQTAHALTVDGIVGKQTWGALGVSTPTATPPSSPPPPPPPPSSNPPTTPKPGPVTAVNPFGLSDQVGAREQQILSAIGVGNFDHEWVPIKWTKNGHTVQVDVSRRALALYDGASRTIVSLSFANAQKVADMLGGVMLTTRAADEIAKQAALKIAPKVQNWAADGSMAKTYRLLEQSMELAQEVGDFGGLVANEGKDWVLTARWWTDPDPAKRHNAANFGWYGGPFAKSTSPGGATVVQSIGLVHNKAHVDYSQLLRFMREGSLYVDGSPMSIAAVLADSNLSSLLQDEGGTIPQPRHPDL